jgi:hypothetical protein
VTTPGGPALPAEALGRAEELRDRLAAAESDLRSFCRNPNFGGDAAACRNFADQVRRFLDVTFPKVEQAIGTGDAHRFSALMLAGSNILQAAEGGPNDLGQGLMITDEVVKTAGEVVEATKKAALGGLALYAVGAGVVVGTKLLGVW